MGLEAGSEGDVLALRLQGVQGGSVGATPRRRLGVDRHRIGADVDRLAQQHAVVAEDAVEMGGMGEGGKLGFQFQLDLGADRARRDFADRILLGVGRGVQVAAFRRLVRGGAHADALGEHEGRQEAEAEHADQAAFVVARLAQAARVADADSGEEAVDFVIGEAGAGVGDAQDVGVGVAAQVDARRRAPARFLDAAAHDGVMCVLHQFAQGNHRRRIQMLAQHRHQTGEIDAGAVELGDARRSFVHETGI